MIKKIVNIFLHFIAYIIPFGRSARPFIHKIRGVKIGRNVWISKYVYLDENHPECISIGENSTVGLRTSIITHFYFGPPQKINPHKVVIGKNVYIGPHCLILPDVTIGDNCVIQGGTVVTRSVPANTMLGYPMPESIAKVTVPLTTENSYEEFIMGLRPVKGNIRKNSHEGK